MSAKWRALQHRHRYTYSSVIFPDHFSETLNQAPCLPFFSELKHLASLNSTYSQVEHAKSVASSFARLLSNPGENETIIYLASKCYLEVFFLENSLPLHRTLVSVLAKAKKYQVLIRDGFRELCEEYGNGNGKGKGKKFCVSRAALTIMSTPKLGYLVDMVEEHAVLVALDVVSGLSSVVSGTSEWSRPSPLVIEQCQESLSCLYYLLQRFPRKFSDGYRHPEGEAFQNMDVLRMVLSNIMSILKSQAFSRDCFVAAGVSFWTALLACLEDEELGVFIMEGIFGKTSLLSHQSGFVGVITKIPYEASLVGEISNLNALSRLCLIRGLLTTVSRAVLNTRFLVTEDYPDGPNGSGDECRLSRSIIYDCILPELCNFCENPPDSHFNFHVLTVMQICLQQIKTSLQSDEGNIAESYDPISEDIRNRILRIVWNNLEDPLSQTVKQVHLIFDMLLDIQATLCVDKSDDKYKLFLKEMASHLLCLGPRCKGRYLPLVSITKRLGAKTILHTSPDLIFEATKAYIDDDVCSAVTAFLKCFLECLRDEYWNLYGVDTGYTKFRGDCVPAFLCGLASGVTKLRTNLNIYALPILLQLDVDAIFPMLALIGVGKVEEDTNLACSDISYTDMSLGLQGKVAVLISLLKASRSLALIEGDIDLRENIPSATEHALEEGFCEGNSFVCMKGINLIIPIKWLDLALTHADEYLRIDAAELLLLNPKTASLPSPLELSLVRKAVPLNMRCSSTAFQMKWASLFKKFFCRVRTALDRQYKLGTWHPNENNGSDGVASRNLSGKTVVHLAEDLFGFIRWLSCFLFFSCYPSAPYERKIIATDLILIMLNVWSVSDHSTCNSSETSITPYSKEFTSPDSTIQLVGSIIDSWDRLRESSFRILLQFPTPLPGICSPVKVQEAILWAKKFVCSPRVRESDAGALTLRLIFRKYVLELGWIIESSFNIVSCQPQSELLNDDIQLCANCSPAVVYIKSLINWLLAAVEDGEKDLSEACINSFVHGVLLALRYTFEELDWNSKEVLCSISEMKGALSKLLELVMRITSLALGVVSADAWYLPEGLEDMEEDDAFPAEGPLDEVLPEDSLEKQSDAARLADERQSDQIVMVGCWLAMKEVSLLLGTVIRKIPLPTLEESKPGDPEVNGQSTSVTTSDGMLDLKQLEKIGNHFLEVLLKMKHNGAIDKTRAGFTALCNRLLCSDDARLCKLTDLWMEQLMERTTAKGQTVDDLLRRSAGIPAAFTAFFLSEPQGSPKRLLPKALRWLIDLASKSVVEETEVRDSSNDLANLLIQPSEATSPLFFQEADVNKNFSKIRDEGVVPTVHAFNVLRAAFNDTNLATDTSGFAAEAIILSIRAFSSSYWEVRNSACLAYTALVRRMIGFLNVQKRESARRALTGVEFFHRYPSLHSFLFDELKFATDLLMNGSSGDLRSSLAKVVHPSLCPMLILLSRLKPSAITGETGGDLDPFLLLPFIRMCSLQSNFRIRVLASRALTGLISNEKLPVTLLSIASELPCSENKIISAVHQTFNSIHGLLLQLSSLLDSNCRDLVDSSKKDKILNDLIQILTLKSWIGSPQQCPCPILNSCFLSVIDHMLSIARACGKSKSVDSIWNLLWSLSSECLDNRLSLTPSFYDPTKIELRKQAAKSYFNCIFQTSKEIAEQDLMAQRPCLSPSSNLLKVPDLENALSRFVERLESCMFDDFYEVRIAAMKWFLLLLKDRGHGIEGIGESYYHVKMYCLKNIDLPTILIKLLAAEKNDKCVAYILKILYYWSLLDSEESNKSQAGDRSGVSMSKDIDLQVQLWDKYVSLYQTKRHSKIRQMLLCCMGVSTKKFAKFFLEYARSALHKENTSASGALVTFRRLCSILNCISYFVDLIQLHSDASEPVTMRKASAEAIVASGLLLHAGLVGSLVCNDGIPDPNPCSCSKEGEGINNFGQKILDIWFITIKLLEDEDVGLRTELALDVQKCLASGMQIEPRSAVVPMQVEKVIEMSIQHMSTNFGHWINYFNYVCHWVLNAANTATHLSKGDLVRRVFDKEIDNHHEEKLLICQLCCFHLEKLSISPSLTDNFKDKHEAQDFLQRWRERFYQHLTFSVDLCTGGQGGDDWIGSMGNHKDAFLPLYANLLAFFALSSGVFNGHLENTRIMLSEVQELGKILHPFLRNPLISNLYHLVLELHSKMAGETATGLGRTGSLWDGFYPYFLVR